MRHDEQLFHRPAPDECRPPVDRIIIVQSIVGLHFSSAFMAFGVHKQQINLLLLKI